VLPLTILHTAAALGAVRVVVWSIIFRVRSVELEISVCASSCYFLLVPHLRSFIHFQHFLESLFLDNQCQKYDADTNQGMSLEYFLGRGMESGYEAENSRLAR
jgi:hypothetical protein